jgi:hypothetical protein
MTNGAFVAGGFVGLEDCGLWACDDGLTVKWGNFASSQGGALPPTLLPTDPCDDTTVLCYDHSLGAWPP